MSESETTVDIKGITPYDSYAHARHWQRELQQVLVSTADGIARATVTAMVEIGERELAITKAVVINGPIERRHCVARLTSQRESAARHPRSAAIPPEPSSSAW